jgi:hypothetical protein
LSTFNTSGAVLSKIAVDQVMHMNDAQIRNLRLQDIPVENVAILGEKITQIA